MKIKQLKEKTVQGLKDFLPKIGVNDIEGLLNALNDKLSKSQGGEINKPVIITNKDSDYSITINPDGSIYIWSKTKKENIFSLKVDKNDINHFVNINDDIGRGLCISKIHALYGQNDDLCYDGVFSKFYASRYILNGGNNTQVLLGDGTTTGKLVKDIRVNQDNVDKKNTLLLMLQYIDGTALGTEFPAATKELAGLMTANDKAKLDNIENTYLPLSGGTLTGVLRLNSINSDENGLDINNVNGMQSVDQDKVSTPEVWATDGTSIPINTSEGIPRLNSNGKIEEYQIEDLNGYISSQNGNIYSEYDTNNGNTTLNVTGNYDEEGSAGRIRLKYTEDNKGKLSIMLDGGESSVNAEKFSSIISPNKNEVWSTDGGRINVLNLLSNTAIYVAGGIGMATLGVDNTTVIDNPDSILFETYRKYFLAKKDSLYYCHWTANISKNIAPSSRYGIESNFGVFPFNNQLYKFSEYDNIYIATCSNGTCSMKKLTLE